MKRRLLALARAIEAVYCAFVVAVCRAPRRAAILLLLASLPALFFSVRYFQDIHAGLQDLLPADSPSVRALETIHARIGGQAHLTIIAQSPSREDNRRFIGELVRRLDALHLPEAREIQGDVKVERQWVQDHAPLLVDRKSFDGVMDDVDDAVNKSLSEISPLYLDLEDGPDSAHLWDALGKRIDRDFGGQDRFPDGFLETPDGHTVVALIWIAGAGDVDVDVAQSLLGAVQREVAAIRGGYPADLTVAYNGEVPNLVEEHGAILADLSVSSLLVFALVNALIIAYFRSVRGVSAVLFALAPGLLFTFAIGRLSGGTLNSNTAFLGSIIAGNGINYPILLLAYYRVRPDEMPMPEALVSAAKQALPGTLGAAAAASAAYGGLASSSLRGFSQFGWLGAIGMLTTWAFTFLAMPIAVALFSPPRKGQAPSRTEATLNALFDRGRLVRVAAVVLVGFGVFLGIRGIRSARRDGIYEMNMQALRNRESLLHGSASWDAKMNDLFGVWLNPVVALVEDPAAREPLAAELRRALAANADTAGTRVDTIERHVPPRADQDARIARMSELKRPLARVPDAKIPEKARPFVRSWMSRGLEAIAVDSVPASMKQGFAEKDRRTDRSILVFPSLAVNYDDGANVIGFADALRRAKLPSGAVVGGSFLFMAEVIRAVRDEAPRVIALVCALVGAVLLPIFARRPSRIPLVVGTVTVVALSAQLVMFGFGVRINMLNFAAIPITIGVGTDYVVNLIGAMDAFNLDATRACARMGSAILLCSLTTVVGYASLLLAQSGALRTFGQACVLGEIMAVLTVLLLLPLVLRRTTSGAARESGELKDDLV